MDEWKKELWQRIIQDEKEKRTKKPGEITKFEFAEICGITPTQAKGELRRLVKLGIVTTRTIWLEEAHANTALYLPAGAVFISKE